MEKEWVQAQQKRRSQATKVATTADNGAKDSPSHGSKHCTAAARGEQKPERRCVRRPRPKGDGVYVPALYGVKPREITLSDMLVSGSAPKDARYSSGPKRRIHTSTSLQDSKKFIGVVKPKRKKRLTPLKRKVLQERRMFCQQNVQDRVSSLIAVEGADTRTAQSTVVEVQHFVEVGDQAEGDEYAELLADLQALGAEFGEVVAADIPYRLDGGSLTMVGPARLTFRTLEQAMLAQLGLHGLVLGGVALATRMAKCDTAQPGSTPTRTYDLFVDGCVRRSELDDEDEAVEVLNDLKALCGEDTQPLTVEVLAPELAGKWHDCISKYQLPPHPAGEQAPQLVDDGDGGVCIFKFPTLDSAQQAATGFDSKVVGGRVVRAVVDDGRQQQRGGEELKYSIRVNGFISPEDVQDEEDREEIVVGLKELLGDSEAEISVHATVEDTWVQLLASSSAQAEEYRAKLDGLTVAGQQISTSAAVLTGGAMPPTVVVWGLVTKEDLEGDEEELQEVLSDLRQLGEQFSPEVELEVVSLQDGRLLAVRHSTGHGDDDPFVTLRFTFLSEDARDRARARLDGKVVGGSAMIATAGQATVVEEVVVEQLPPPPFNPVEVQPREQKAKSEVVPHLPKHEAPALPIPVASEELQPVVRELLKTLMEYQTRAKERNARKSATKKRLVIGMREIMRDIRARAIKLLVLAPDTEKTGVVDDKVQQLVQTAIIHQVPMLYALSRRQLGKALGTNMRYSAVGIAFADGAYHHFKTIARFVTDFGPISLDVPDESPHEEGADHEDS